MTLTERDKKMLIALGVVAALAVIYLFFFVLPGDGDSGETAEPVPTDTAVPTISPSPTETPRPTSPPIDLVGDRDPFSIPPGLSPSPTGGGVSPTGTTTTTTTPTFSPTVSPTVSPTFSPTVSPTTSPPPPGKPDDQITIGGHDVRLLDVFRHGKRVQVEVDGHVYVVEEGAIFDDNFKLVKILDNGCARFLFGDQSFELCPKRNK
jgi:hypothetical protein